MYVFFRTSTIRILVLLFDVCVFRFCLILDVMCDFLDMLCGFLDEVCWFSGHGVRKSGHGWMGLDVVCWFLDVVMMFSGCGMWTWYTLYVFSGPALRCMCCLTNRTCFVYVKKSLWNRDEFVMNSWWIRNWSRNWIVEEALQAILSWLNFLKAFSHIKHLP